MKVKLKDLPKVTSVVDGKGKRDRSGKKLNEVLALYKTGKSYIEIASELGLSYANVHYYVRKNKGTVDSRPETV